MEVTRTPRRSSGSWSSRVCSSSQERCTDWLRLPKVSSNGVVASVQRELNGRIFFNILGVWGTASSLEALFGVFEFAPVVLAAWLWLARPLRGQMIRMST